LEISVTPAKSDNQLIPNHLSLSFR